ncbi:MAG: hypothetical protein KJ558_11190, partial [Gammaproteobacteria bacterium]|nr:hypothetical protein [Gammaproteobacteria bacterium]
CGSGMNRHFQWPKPLKMKKTKNRIFRFRLAKWPGWPFCKFLKSPTDNPDLLSYCEELAC